MSPFRIGDRVRDISPHAAGLGTTSGTIIGKDEGGNWEINWDATPFSRINWHDHQIAYLDGPNRIVELKFVNSDATPKTVELRVSVASVEPIMAWYGAYFARDRYTVLVDGELVGSISSQPNTGGPV